jgi:hypothetical protein
MAKENDAAQRYAPDGTSGATANGKNIIDQKTAEAEFVRYCEANDIDCDMAGMKEEDRASFEPIKNRFIKACKQGRAKVDGRNLKYTISDFSPAGFSGREITIERCSGHAFMGMDGYKDTQSVHKMNGFLSAMTGQETSFFAKIDGSDWLFFRDIATLFLVD